MFIFFLSRLARYLLCFTVVVYTLNASPAFSSSANFSSAHILIYDVSVVDITCVGPPEQALDEVFVDLDQQRLLQMW